MKICRICRESKPLADFYPRSNSKDGRRSDCITCKNARSSKWMRENREVARFHSKAYRSANREVERARNSRNYAAYRRAHPERLRAKHAKRRAAKRNAMPLWSASEFDSLAIKEAYRLAVEREEATGFAWHVDHIYPLISDWVCGLHCGANLQVIPWIENVRKGNRL